MDPRHPVSIGPGFEAWHAAAHDLLRQEIAPDQVEWRAAGQAALLFEAAPAPVSPEAAPGPRVPRRFVDLAREVAARGTPDRWALLYKVLWRIVHENHDLLQVESDSDVARLLALEREARGGPAVAPPEPVLESAAPFVPPEASLDALRRAAAACTGCELHRFATQTVFGVGPQTARVILLGEQPGDQEDLQGAPFVGPAGQVLDRALAEVGLPREQIYLTNVVKHFKFVQRGKRRIHETPRDREILACQPWLEAELRTVSPEVLVCLGATASRAIFGPWFRLMQQRGTFLPTRFAKHTLATLHPSAVLRAQDEPSQERLYGLLKTDLTAVAAAVTAAAAR